MKKQKQKTGNWRIRAMLRVAWTMFMVFVLLIVVGCGQQNAATDCFELVIGSRGHTSGKFNRPRGIIYHQEEDAIFVIDWDGRIQKFTTDGQFRASWLMPETKKGKPEDLCIAQNGNILVTDTHYSRIMEFSPNGDFVQSFGSYGREPGQFIYPVGICCDQEGYIYVSEYGENDRIQKFTADGAFVCSWGSFGVEPGQFQRPSGIDISIDNRLFVSDAVNHRIQVFDSTGKLIRIIGKEGTGPGEFRYPYDVVLHEDNLYVLEYGNQRVQKLTLEGKPIAIVGQPGRGDEHFASPWRCASVKESLYVSDTENNRVVKLKDSF